MIIDNKLITVIPGSNFKFTLYLSYLVHVIGVTFRGIVFMVISKLPGAITDNRQRIKAVNHWEVILQPKSSFCYFMLQTKNSVTSLFFVRFS